MLSITPPLTALPLHRQKLYVVLSGLSPEFDPLAGPLLAIIVFLLPPTHTAFESATITNHLELCGGVARRAQQTPEYSHVSYERPVCLQQ